MSRMPLVVLISGSGSNLQAIMDACARGDIGAEISAVISDRAQALGLQRAQRAGLVTEVVEHTAHPGRVSFERELMRRIEAHRPGLVAAAGFMRVLSDGFIDRFQGRMLNIHPSLLPALPGLHTHRRALASGLTRHGCSVHFVTRELDAGPVVVQAALAVGADDDAERLATRVLEKEHIIYPRAIAWFCEGRLALRGDEAILDGEALAQPILLEEAEQTAG